MGAGLGRSLDIAITGAGTGGLAAALFLTRAGHRVTLFERFAAPRPVGSGLMLQPTGLAVLDSLGLLGTITALGARVDRMIGTDSKSGRVVLDVGYQPLGSDVHAVAVHRAALFNVLHDAIVADDIAVQTGFTVCGLSATGGGHYLEDGKGRREGPFDLVVDASGANSRLKPFAKHAAAPRPLEFGAIWGTFPWIDEGFNRNALMQRYWRSSVMIGVLPIGRQVATGPELAAFFWSLKPAEYEAVRAAGIDAWRATVRQHWPQTEPHLSQIEDFEQMTLACYTHATMRIPAGNCIAFIGDSAHSTSPQLGQGANMALLDAAALATAIERSASVADALKLYVRLRRWHVRLYQLLSLTLTPFYQSDSVIYPLMRDLLVSGLAKMPPAPWLLAGMVSGQLLSPLEALGLKTSTPSKVRR